MKKYWQALGLFFLVILLIIIRTPLSSSQEITDWSDYADKTLIINQMSASSPINTKLISEISNNPAIAINNQQNMPVTLDGEILFYYSSQIKGIPAGNRAQLTAQKIEEIADDFSIKLNSLNIVELEGLRVIATKKELIFALIEADAQLANQTLDKLAQDYLQKVKDGIIKYRQQRSLQKKIMPYAMAGIQSLLFMGLWLFLKKSLCRVYGQIETWKSTILRPLKIQSLQLLSLEQEVNILSSLVKLIYWVVVGVVLFLYCSSLTHYFPQTMGLGSAIFSYLYDLIKVAIKAAIAYLPNLFTIILSIVLASYVVRFCRLFFEAIEKKTLALPGFDREWAQPTEKLATFLIIAFTLAIVVPLLPGSDSPAFKGISIFAGALFTLGSASAIANIVGGVVIIYTRAFRVGDRVQIDGVRGDILEKTILSTRICTPKNEIVTIPNANLLSSNIRNFTTSLRDINQPLLLHSTITLGYDVPWRKVHQILIEAALSSPSILAEPEPFVLQTSLGDFSVSYELNAYTNQPSKMSQAYSQLYQNIQDQCNAAGIEILSPQYSAIRDGNQNTLPDDYLPQDYTAPGFRLDLIEKLSHLSFAGRKQQKR
ncbi:MAG: mechanosensitive ion channel family protein [Cyanobacteria bacterium J06621_8]